MSPIEITDEVQNLNREVAARRFIQVTASDVRKGAFLRPAMSVSSHGVGPYKQAVNLCFGQREYHVFEAGVEQRLAP